MPGTSLRRRRQRDTALITTALCADAVRPGRVPGQDFHIRPAAGADGGRLRVEVSDT
ncbi:hypothetical protein [Streptomyces sp. NPDC050388]|uniref:hypothetical protein n=1 Tax=Streptomyces sp. NPDC050388 TaxID=3155781 RepID=UPI00342E88ED